MRRAALVISSMRSSSAIRRRWSGGPYAREVLDESVRSTPTALRSASKRSALRLRLLCGGDFIGVCDTTPPEVVRSADDSPEIVRKRDEFVRKSDDRCENVRDPDGR